MKRRIVSFLLVLCLVVGVLPTTEAMANDDVNSNTDSTMLYMSQIPLEDEVTDDAQLSKQLDSQVSEVRTDENTGNTYIPYDGASYELTYSVNEGGTLTITGYTGTAKGKLILPESIGGKNVTQIGDRAFYACKNFTGDLVIPKCVTKIGDYAFAYCSGFSGELRFSDMLQSIGYETFSDCSGFTGNLIIPDNVTEVGALAFDGCSGFDGDLIIGSGLKVINRRTFFNCYGFTGKLELGNSIITIDGGAFYNCSGLSGSLTIPESVQAINSTVYIGPNPVDYGAFENCKSLSGDLVIPDGVVTIGAKTFCNCVGFDGCLTIGNSVTDIGACAFYGCSSLTGSLIIPESVKTISSYLNYIYQGQYYRGGESRSFGSFANCDALTGVLVIGENVEEIGPGAFYGCSGLTGDIVIPDKMMCIKSSTFYGCSGFNGELIIPNTVTAIGDAAFYNCSNLSGNLDIPDAVTILEKNTFYNCRCLTGSLVIPDSVESIGYNCFYGCSGFAGDLIIPDSVAMIGSDAFYGCSGFTGSLIIGSGITAITSEMFSGCTDFLGDLIIGENVSDIERESFSNFKFRGKLVLGSSLASIGDYAFSGCSGFTGELIFPSGLISIGNYAFYNCGNFTGNLIVPDTVTQMGYDAFRGCSGFDGSLEISRGLTSIPTYAFGDCSGLTGKLTIPNEINEIGADAFSGCSGLSGDLIIPDSVRNIGSGAFRSCTGFTGNLSISSNVTKITSNTFDGCKNLTSVTIPDSVTSIGNYAFRDCTSLTSVTIPDSVTSIGNYAFHDCISLTSVMISNGVTSIGSDAFRNCTSLTSVTIPDSVTSIGSDAFYNCTSLTSVTISNNVASIRFCAFYGCSNLSDVYYSGSESDWLKITIEYGNSCLTNATIHYNSTGPDEPNPTDDNTSIYFLSGWDETTRRVSFSFDYNETGFHYTYTVAEDVDVSNISEMVNKYVLVTAEQIREDDEIAPVFIYTVTDIQPVESAIGTLSAIDEESIVIDGVTYPSSEMSRVLWGGYKGKEVLYHVFGGEIRGITEIVEKAGTLEAWDETTGRATIDGVEYATNFLTDLSFAGDIGDRLNNQYYFTTATTSGYTVLLGIGSAYYPGGKREDFNADIYHAKWLSAGGNGTETVLGLDTPSEILYDLLSEGNMGTAADLWKSFELVFETLDDVTKLKDFALEPKDVYSALILNALEASVSYDVISSEYEDAYKMFKSFFSDFKTVMKTGMGIDLNNSEDFQNFYNMQGKDVDAILEDWASTWFKKSYPTMSDISKSLGYISMAMQAVGDIEECAEYAASCYTLTNLGTSMETVLQYSYDKCKSVYGPLDNLTLAFKECLEMVNLSMDELDAKINKKVAIVIGVEGAEYIIGDLLWGEVTSYISTACPELAILQLTYKAMKTISDQIFNTDDAVEQYLKLDYMTDIESLIDAIYWDLEADFNNSLTVELAQAYLSSMELSFALRDVDCETAIKYVDIVQTSLAGSLLELFGAEDYEGLKDAMRDIQTEYKLQYEVAETFWIAYLEDDYPGSGLYEFYNTLYESVPNIKLIKQITAACPVDVYVYDQSDNVVAYVANGRVSCSVDDLMIALVGDTKVIRLFEDADYRIEYVGYDTGDMDITISEFDEDENTTRTVNYYDVVLNDGKTYSLDADDDTLKPYELVDEEDDSVVDWDYDSMQASAAHTVKVVSGTLQQGSEIYTETTASKGETLQINAYIPDGYEFVQWEVTSEDAVIADIFAANTSMIMPDEDVTITAVVKNIQTSDDPIESYTITFNTNGGTVSVDTMTTGTDGKLESLPMPTRDGYTFDGWYTAIDGGTEVTTDTVFTADTIVYAHWTADSASPSTPVEPDDPTPVEPVKPITPSKPSTSTTTTPAEPEIPFTDVSENASYYDAVKYVYDEGLMEGTSATKFAPSSTLTRGMVATILYRMEGEPTAVYAGSFTDVADGVWYTDGVEWAAKVGVVKGYTNGKFGPNDPVTREQLAAMLYRYAEYKGYDVSKLADLADYADGANVSEYAKTNVAWAAANGILESANSKLRPTDTATRAEVAVAVAAFHEKFVK